MSPHRLVLASASPRRRELLTDLGVPFDVIASEVDESAFESNPARLAEGLALRKARAVAEANLHRVVVGVDTVVVDGDRALGKPVDAAEARAMLEALRGRTHEVVTAVAVIDGERVAADHVRTAVHMRDYSDTEIAQYVDSGEPFDKAGGYALQDERFRAVEAADGCVCSVIGLPLWTVRRLLRVAGGVETRPPSFFRRCAGCPLAEAR